MRRLIILSLLFPLFPATQVQAGWPFFSDGPRRGTPEYLEMRAAEPPGRRQFFFAGKAWPPRPRPLGEDLPCIHTYHAAHYWPSPYVCQDREIVQAFSNIQVHNGWIEATTFFDYHFEPDAHILNLSGRQHLQWILMHVPFEHRFVHLAQAFDPAVNMARVASLETEMAQLVGIDHSLPVLLRVASPSPRPAAELDMIYRHRSTNILPPAINYSVE